MNLYNKIHAGGVYVIAEMSANHGGSIENAYKIIEEAAKAGADCVKIQTYTADTLTIDCDKPCFRIKGGLWDGYTFYDLYKDAYTPWEWQDDLKKKCEEVGVDFLSTPFDNTAVDFLESINVEAYKIASFELVDIPLIEYAASKGKPMIMSCGMASPEEIQEAINACKRQGNHQIVLLKCCSQYPARYEDMNLSVIPDMKKRFGVAIGLSDHSFGSLAPIVAATLGATVIEKHVRLDENVESADSGFSMKMSDFKQMVDDVNNAILVQGKATYELTDNELSGLTGRRSLFAVKDIKKGEKFTKDNVRSIRPSDGIKPKYYNQLLKGAAKKDYEFGDPIDISEVN
ncbi:MAG: pseudaminic acid synthase [Lachnospiraceae bacterium]|nr:pseudaminic acid synthase [Lachnospiraceae bacterium]